MRRLRPNTDVCLVRHGATDWNLAGRMQGHTDIALNDAGRKQAQAAGRRLAAERWDRLFTSPLARAKETASIVASHIQLRPAIEAALIERRGGPLEGLTRTEIDRLYPDRWLHPVAGVERVDALTDRAVGVMDRLVAQHPGERLVIVSHGAWINAFLACVSDGRWGVTNLVNGGLTFVRRQTRTWQALRVNETSHLEHVTGQTDIPEDLANAGPGEDGR